MSISLFLMGKSELKRLGIGVGKRADCQECYYGLNMRKWQYQGNSPECRRSNTLLENGEVYAVQLDSTKFVLSFDRFTRVQQLNDWIVSQVKAGNNDLTIDAKSKRTYSNVCAPIAGILDYYKEKGVKIRVNFSRRAYIRHTRVWNPLSIEECIESEKYYPFDKVWTFSTSEGVNELVSAYILELRKSDKIEEGVISSVEWCLNEVMDNVLQHSGIGKGYVMAQIHKQSKMFAFCVFDAGMGFYNSLKNTKHHPEKPIDAITLALQEKITRDEKIGQGNGLWGLTSIVSQSNGQMEVSSGGAKYRFREGKITTKKERGFTLSKQNGTAYIDVRLNYGKEINIVDALTDSKGTIYTPTDLWLENLEDDLDRYIVKVSEHASGTGTRQSAEKLRNMVLNISNNHKKIVVLDFDGVNLISSSFADELVGKMISEKGFLYFTQAFRIVNVTPSNTSILNRSVGQRMAQVYFEEVLSEI